MRAIKVGGITIPHLGVAIQALPNIYVKPDEIRVERRRDLKPDQVGLELSLTPGMTSWKGLRIATTQPGLAGNAGNGSGNTSAGPFGGILGGLGGIPSGFPQGLGSVLAAAAQQQQAQWLEVQGTNRTAQKVLLHSELPPKIEFWKAPGVPGGAMMKTKVCDYPLPAASALAGHTLVFTWIRER